MRPAPLRRRHLLSAALLSGSLLFSGCQQDGSGGDSLTLYSGRGEPLVAPLIEAFERESGTQVDVRYGGTAELANLLQEEGGRSPACVFWAQDVAALGTTKPLLTGLPASITDQVEPVFRDRDGKWIGTSGRARLLIYSPERLQQADLPSTMAELTDPRYRGRLAVAPTNGSFVAHVAAMRVKEGDGATEAWLKGIAANDPVIVRNNTAQHQAIADGEADLASTNNYYLGRFKASDPDFPVAQTQFEPGDIGNLMLVAGVGILESCNNKPAARTFVEFLASPTAQQYFTGSVFEYPVTGVSIVPEGTAGVDYATATANAPEVDLNDLTDMQGTLALINRHLN
ncbi:MAG: extracellular solute-binding protein [Synechococcaceae cyanobacterium]